MTNFAKYHLSDAPRIISPHLPGKKSKELLAMQQHFEGSVVSYPVSIPIAIKQAKGAIIEDVDGNHFLDFFAGAGVLNVGHCNEEVLKRVREQQDLLIHALDFPTENKLEAIQKILSCLPTHLRDQYKVSFGGPTGSDAVEAAVKLAKIKTGRDAIIAFSGSYHGMTAGALALTSDVNFRKKFSGLMPNVHFAPFCYCYRCPFGKESKTCKLDCFQYLKNMLENKHSGIPTPAAIVIEPIQGEGGNIPALPKYLEKIVALARRHGVLVIFDEIQSGFFRSGEFLSFMKTDAIPDIITISKGFGGIGFPLSGLIYRRDVEAWGPGDHIGTFRSNQVSLAATNGALDFAQRHNLKAHVDEMEIFLMESLEVLKLRSPYIGEVRGRGLMIGVEVVKCKSSKEPFPEFVRAFRRCCFQKGLIFEVGGHFGNVIRLLPPLIVTKKMIKIAVEIMAEALDEVALKYSNSAGKAVELI